MSDLSLASQESSPPSKLSKAQLVSLTLASFVPAVGISSFPVLIVGSAGYGSWVSALISAVAAFAIGRTIIVFSRRYVVSGSLSSYLFTVFGPWARGATAASLFLGYLGQLMSCIVLFATFGVSFLTGLGFASAGEPSTMIVLFLFAGLVPAGVAWKGLDTSVRTAVVLAVLSVPLLLFISGASAVHTGLELSRQLTLEGASFSGIILGLGAGAVWFVSFESAASLATETSDPQKNVPAAIMAWPVVLGTTYLLMTFLQVPGLMAVGDELEAGMSAPAALANHAGLGPTMGQVVDLVLAVAVFAALIGFTNYASRVTLAYAEEGLLPNSIATLGARYGTPVRAIILNTGLATAILVATMLVSPSAIFTLYSAVATLTVYFWVLPYVLICGGAVIMLAREKQLSPGIIISAALGVLTMAYLVINSILNPTGTALDLMVYVAVAAVVVLGGLFYVSGRRSKARRTEMDLTRSAATK